MPVLLMWAGFLLLPAVLILALLWFIARPLLRRGWALLTSLLPWRTDFLGQRVLCTGCGHQIRAGRGPAAYDKCSTCKAPAARALRVA